MNDTAMALHRQGHPNLNAFVEGVPKQLLIDGKWVPVLSGHTFPTIDPTTETVIAQVSEGAAEDVEIAVAAAPQALVKRNWSAI